MTSWFTRPQTLGLPGPTAANMVTALPQIRRFAPEFLTRCVQRYGPLVSFPVPGTPTLLAGSPDAAWQVLVAEHAKFSKDTPQYVSLSALTGTGLLTSDGQTWKRRRSILQPAFARGGLPAVVAQSAQAALTASRSVPPSGEADAEALMLGASLDVVGDALLGSTLGADGSALIKAILTGLDVVVADVASPQPVPRFLPTPRRARMRAAQQALDEASAGLVAARRAEHASMNTGEPMRRADLLDRLLAALDAGQIDPDGVRDELVTTVIAGHETVASALTWALHLLSTHPREQQEARAEAIRAVGCRPQQEWPGWLAAHARELGTLRAVVDEALRLFPPAWVISRRATQDTAISGVEVPAGTLVIVSPWQLHRDPGVYEQPDRFCPSRFGKDSDARPTGQYLPFGAGPRLCIGRDMARVESVAMLAVLLAQFRVEPHGHRPRPQALVTLRPTGGLPLRFVGSTLRGSTAS